MFAFGHLGVGEAVAKPFSRGLPRAWLLLGTLVPDLIDKPLYYGLAWATGLRGEALGLISGTRTIGHTGLFLLVIAAWATWRRSRVLAAIALGVATHLLLDNVSDSWMPALAPGERSTLYSLLFPLMGFKFPAIQHADFSAHLSMGFRPGIWVPEILGASVLIWETWKQRHSSEILRAIADRRQVLKQRKSRRQRGM